MLYVWKCHFPKEWLAKSDFWASDDSITWELFFFLSSVCSWFLPLTYRIRWNLTVRTFGISSSSHWCLLKLGYFAIVEVSVKAQELTFTKQLKQQMLSASWQIISCSRQRWTWSIQSDFTFFVVDNSFHLLGLAISVHERTKTILGPLYSVLCWG